MIQYIYFYNVFYFNSNRDGRSPYSIVTAMVDELILYDSQIKPNYDVTMRGHVSWVGKTSIEVAMVMSQFGRDFLATKFLMVARDASGKKLVFQNMLN